MLFLIPVIDDDDINYCIKKCNHDFVAGVVLEGATWFPCRKTICPIMKKESEPILINFEWGKEETALRLLDIPKEMDEE